jgi:lysozyme
MANLKQLARVAVATLAISASGLGFISKEEGTVQRVYLDSIGLPTVCTGHMDRSMKVGTLYTAEHCAQLLRTDVGSASYAVRKAIKVPLYQYEFDALVSFCFNVGNANCSTSTMFKLINQGSYHDAGLQFKRWSFAGGLDCRVRSNNCYGVALRRVAEAKLWRGEY